MDVLRWLDWLSGAAFWIILNLLELLLLGLPFLLVGLLVWRNTRVLRRPLRSALVALPLAAGLAPYFEPGPMGSVYPIYLTLLFPRYTGVERADVLVALVSFGITFVVAFAVMAWLMARRSRPAAKP